MTRYAGVLGERNFALFFLGYSVSLLGSGMMPVALTFAVLGQGHGPEGVGLVLGAETAAMVALLLLGGVIADRWSRKVVMVAADLVRCLAQVVLALALITSWSPIWLMMLTGVVLGAGQAFFGPALTGLVPAITSPARLQQANGLIGVAKWAGQVAGPAFAGVLVAIGGAHWAIFIDGLSYAAGAACLMGIAMPRELSRAAPEPFLRQLRLGWVEFTAQTWLWVIVVQFAFYRMLVLAPAMVLGALVAQEHLGGASGWGLILSGEGVGAVLGGLGSLRLRPRRPLLWATLGTFSALPFLILLAWVAPLWSIVLAAALWGAGFALFLVLFDTTLQERVPREALSRVSSYDWLGSYALLPIGYALVGPASELLGTRGTLEASAIWLLAASTLVLLVPSVRQPRQAVPTALGVAP